MDDSMPSPKIVYIKYVARCRLFFNASRNIKNISRGNSCIVKATLIHSYLFKRDIVQWAAFDQSSPASGHNLCRFQTRCAFTLTVSLRKYLLILLTTKNYRVKVYPGLSKRHGRYVLRLPFFQYYNILYIHVFSISYVFIFIFMLFS